MGFDFNDPEGEVSLVGTVSTLCSGGLTLYFGTARNTGDTEVQNVKAEVAAFDSSSALLGRFRGSVVRKLETEIDSSSGVTTNIINDTLETEETGTFSIQTGVGCGDASSTTVSFIFSVSLIEG